MFDSNATTDKVDESTVRAAHTARPVSPLTQEQWADLEAKASAANEAIAQLRLCIFNAILSADKDPELSRRLWETSDKIADAERYIPSGYNLHAQSEWMGGESFAVREPHFCGMRRHTVLSGKGVQS